MWQVYHGGRVGRSRFFARHGRRWAGVFARRTDDMRTGMAGAGFGEPMIRLFGPIGSAKASAP
ncbi:hypothetical protein LL06_05585 [Hoeflea sp. BAL378]|nr:hypothetical protein LL06_05585 [Hoeflea sp. BAL378]